MCVYGDAASQEAEKHPYNFETIISTKYSTIDDITQPYMNFPMLMVTHDTHTFPKPPLVFKKNIFKFLREVTKIDDGLIISQEDRHKIDVLTDAITVYLHTITRLNFLKEE